MNRPLPKLPESLNYNLNAHAKPFNPLQHIKSGNAAKPDKSNSEDPISTLKPRQSENVRQSETHDKHVETPLKATSKSFVITEDLIKFDNDTDLISFSSENSEVSPESPLNNKSKILVAEATNSNNATRKDSNASENDETDKTYNPILKLHTEDNLTCIKISCPQAINGFVNLIVDTGSTHSLLKMTCLKPDTIYNPERRIDMEGISGHRMTVGETNLNLKFGRKNVSTTFQIINDSPPDNDGILGKNILDNSILNFKNMTLTFIEAEPTLHRVADKLISLAAHPKCITSQIPDNREPDIIVNNFPSDTEIEINNFDEILTEEAEEEEINKYIKSLNKVSAKSFIFHQKTTRKNADAANEQHRSRVERIIELIDINHLNETRKKQVEKLINDHASVFKLDDETLPPAKVEQIDVEFTSTTPINSKQYRLPKSHINAAYDTALEWLHQGIIEESNSPYNSPLLVVPKAGKNTDGSPKLRTCIDLRNINKIIKKKYFHIPPIQALLADLPSGTSFISVDLVASYLQFAVTPQTAEKLAFTIKHRRFQFKRLPFGMKLSGDLFAEKLTKILDKLLSEERLVAYLDDILIISETDEEALQLLHIDIRLMQKSHR